MYLLKFIPMKALAWWLCPKGSRSIPRWSVSIITTNFVRIFYRCLSCAFIWLLSGILDKMIRWFFSALFWTFKTKSYFHPSCKMERLFKVSSQAALWALTTPIVADMQVPLETFRLSLSFDSDPTSESLDCKLNPTRGCPVWPQRLVSLPVRGWSTILLT